MDNIFFFSFVFPQSCNILILDGSDFRVCGGKFGGFRIEGINVRQNNKKYTDRNQTLIKVSKK